jgi:hypothetical protein
MSDQFDHATELEGIAREASIQAARNAKSLVVAKGECYNCGETLAPDVLFCDEHCRDDWQRRNPTK